MAAITIVITNAAASPPSASARWISRRRRRGTNASTSVPATATPKTSSIGSSWPYSMCGGVMAVAASPPEIAVTGPVPSGQRAARGLRAAAPAMARHWRPLAALVDHLGGMGRHRIGRVRLDQGAVHGRVDDVQQRLRVERRRR